MWGCTTLTVVVPDGPYTVHGHDYGHATIYMVMHHQALPDDLLWPHSKQQTIAAGLLVALWNPMLTLILTTSARRHHNEQYCDTAHKDEPFNNTSTAMLKANTSGTGCWEYSALH